MHYNCFFRLTDCERERLGQAIDSVLYDPHGGMQYIEAIRKIGFEALPRRIINALSEQRASISPKPYLVFANLPIDKQVFTVPDPQTFTPSAKSGFRSENLSILFSSLIGEPYSIHFKGENIVNNLIPISDAKHDYTGLGSEIELDFHIENAALKFMGDYNFSPLGLLLTGVRHDPHGPMTRISDARLALKKLPPKALDYLKLPLYKIKIPYRWRSLGANDITETDPVPLIKGNIKFPDIGAVFYSDMVMPLTNEAAWAMKMFYEAINKVSFAIDIIPGLLIYIDNRFTLHSRDKFIATLDINNKPLRWVQRVFIASNLWNHRHLIAIKDRVFQTPE